MIDLHDRWNRVRPASALDGYKDLLSGLMDHQIIDDDLVVGRTEECSKLLIKATDQITPFKVVKITKLHVGLRCQILLPKREGVNRGGGDVAHEKDIVGAERENTCRSERTG
jgi:hypothetical protein